MQRDCPPPHSLTEINDRYTLSAVDAVRIALASSRSARQQSLSQSALRSLCVGSPLPPNMPRNQQLVRILEEALRISNDIEGEEDFWYVPSEDKSQ